MNMEDTLIDIFAGQAMAALIIEGTVQIDRISMMAYEQAQSMIAEKHRLAGIAPVVRLDEFPLLNAVADLHSWNLGSKDEHALRGITTSEHYRSLPEALRNLLADLLNRAIDSDKIPF